MPAISTAIPQRRETFAALRRSLGRDEPVGLPRGPDVDSLAPDHRGRAMRPMYTSILRTAIRLLACITVATAIGIADDYGMGPAQAATLPAGPAPAAPAPFGDAPAGTANPAEGAAQDANPGRGYVRLPGHLIPEAKIREAVVDRQAQTGRIDLTLVLRHDDQAGFERYLHDVYDPASAIYRRFLSQAQIAQRYGPSERAYDSARRYLRQHGLVIDRRSKNRLTLMAHGSRQAVESAFKTHIDDYRLHGQRFYANDSDPAVPAAMAPHIESVIGLASLARPEARVGSFSENIKNAKGCVNSNPLTFSSTQQQLTTNLGCAVQLAFWAVVYDLGCLDTTAITLTLNKYWDYLTCKTFDLSGNNATSAARAPRAHRAAQAADAASPSSASSTAAAAVNGAGQTIGLVEFDNYNTSDVSNFLALIGAPPANIGQLSEKNVGGGAAVGAAESEVLLDIDAVMTIAPGAKVTVYDAPFSGAGSSFQAMFNAMIDDGVTVISNSWAYCEDQTTLADVQSIDSILQAAAAAGISVLSGSGDSGSTCLDGSANTVAVPADSPHITAVGGTSVQIGPGYTYGSETWWNGTASTPATGQGGFGVSKFFARPSYQAGLDSGSMRSVPDVVAGADPATAGIALCQADAGGCPDGLLTGGTSLSTPMWAAYTALINQSEGKNLGLLNPLLYPLANTASFHSAAGMGSDSAHVGLGSPNVGVLTLALEGKTAGAVSAPVSGVQLVSPSVSADGQTKAYAIVDLHDTGGNAVSGKTVTLSTGGGSATLTPSSGISTVANGTAVFTLTDLTPENLTLTATDTTDGIVLTQTGALAFVAPTAASGGIVAAPTDVTADGQTPATVTVTLEDALNRPSPGKVVEIADGGAHAAITGPTPAVTDANGEIQFSATDQVNETVTFTAVDVTDGDLPVPGSATVTYGGSTTTACNVGVIAEPGTGYAIAPYITGLPAATSLFYDGVDFVCPGGNDPTFTSAGNVLVTDGVTGGVYQIGLAGGVVSSSNLLTTLTPAIGNGVYGKDGSLYAAFSGGDGEIVQLDPTTGAILRVLASGLSCPADLAVDPLSGDLFYDNQCTGGDPSIWRIIDPANTDAGNPTLVVAYATLPNTPNGGLAFAPNGTLFAVSGYVVGASGNAPVEEVSGTNASTVTVTALTGIASDYGVAIGTTNTDGSAQSLIVEPGGTLSEVPIANPSAAVVLATGAPGVGVTGPDGCLYTVRYDTVYRLANSSGACTFSPTSPAPSIKLAPASVSPNPSQGGTETLTATLTNVSSASGIPVYFHIAGANAALALVTTDSAGTASYTYTGTFTGSDTLTANTTVNDATLQSNAVHITWASGKHVTFVSLNTAPHGSTVGQSVTVTASLTDESVTPAAALGGESVTFTLNGSSCTGTTDSTGIASCRLSTSTVGKATLHAEFSGTGTLVAATDSIGFNVMGTPTAPPTVTIAVNPANVAAGGTATLIWSSTNATACTASGGWSGSVATSGTRSVIPAATGSYSYTLTCNGYGGSASASAVLSATLVAVTVTTKSGGGALSGYVCLGLGLLVLMRYRRLRVTLASTRAGESTRADADARVGAALRADAPARSAGRQALSVAGLLASAALTAAMLLAAGLARADQAADSGSAQADPPSGAATAAGGTATPAAGTATPATGDPAAATGTVSAASASPAWLDALYVGVRAGSMPVRLDAGKIDAGLAALGYGNVAATTDTSGIGGTLYVGYELAPHADVEFAYTYRNASVATLSGAVASTADTGRLLRDTTELVRGYGNIFSLSFRSRFELAPRLTIDPRVGAFVWSTGVTADAQGMSFSDTRQGGGITVGVGLAYRVWRGLELGVGTDFFRGAPNNIATLYGGSLEWRFGR